MRIDVPEGIDSECFCRAFADYLLPITLSEEQFRDRLHRLDYRKEISVGLFDGKDLVGFILNGQRGDVAYDCGTAIWKEYRGRGYGKALLEAALSSLRRESVSLWKLEVLEKNGRAHSMYRDFGFAEKRNFDCFAVDREALSSSASPSVTLVPATAGLLRESAPLVPSWQNENESVRKAGTPVFAILAGRRRVGYLVFDVATGTILQLFIEKEERRRGYGSAAIRAAASLTKNVLVKCNNIDRSYLPMEGLFRSLGFSLSCCQYEMQRSLDSGIVVRQ